MKSAKILIAGDSISHQRKGGYAAIVMRLHPEWEVVILRHVLGYFGNSMIWLDPEALIDYCQRCYGTNVKYAKSLIRGSIPFDELMVEPEYDVIHLNSGLHDIQMARSPLTNEFGPIVPIERYEENLDYIVNRILTKTSSKLIWASTTPVNCPGRRPHRRNEDVIAYNKIAEKVMKKYDIVINDLYKLVMDCGIDECLHSGLHLNRVGRRLAGEQTARYISEALG